MNNLINLTNKIHEEYPNTVFEMVHLKEIKPGDTIIYREQLHTVGKAFIKYDSFMGYSIFGCSYISGYQKCIRVHFVVNCLNGQRIE